MLESRPRSPNIINSDVAAAKATLRAKTLREQQAVLSLQALSQQDQVSKKVLGNQIVDLTDKLILGAGEDVVKLAEREEREQLEVFQSLITRRLSILQGSRVANGKSGDLGDGMIAVNGDGNEYGKRNGDGARRGRSMSKSESKSTSTSKSRERKPRSRGRS